MTINSFLLAALAIALAMYAGWARAQDEIVFYPSVTAISVEADPSGKSVAHTQLIPFVIEGRIIDRKQHEERYRPPKQDDGKRSNLKRNLGLMINRERKHYPVTVKLGNNEWPTQTDQEGYFRIEVSADTPLTPGWHQVEARTAQTQSTGRILVVPTTNVHGIISDIDDTVLVTEVNSKRRMLANTFLNNPLQRQAVPGITRFYNQLIEPNPHVDQSAVIYLSASPRQLHTAVQTFLDHNHFREGILITKRVTDDSSSEPIRDQVAYKTQKIENILSQLPQVRFSLIGDDGESDPEIYAAIRERFPDRIEAIWIRRVNPDPNRARLPNQGDLNSALERFMQLPDTDH
jgi:phosphatidate phosphatase APP1